MQVVEIKNDLVQVRYNTEEQAFSLGDFFVVSDNNNDILAQIIHLETDDEDALCLAKFILNINSDQSTSLYNGYMPSLDSVVSPVSKKEISDFIAPLSDGIKAGSLINSELPVTLSSTLLESALYIQSDYSPACANLIDIIFFKNEIKENTIFYDIDGIFDGFDVPKFEPGKQFKIPLNKTFIDFIYKNDLNELEITEKSLVQDILLEIKDYIETTDKKFIEFSTLFDVVDGQYQQQPSEGLMLFRNKLIEYKQLGFFADNEAEACRLEEIIEQKNVVIYVYHMPKNWQKVILKYLIEIISSKTHLVVQISDKTADETILSDLIVSKYITPVFISDYASKFRKFLRAKVPNMIFFQAINEISDFPLYSNFLSLLYDNTYIIWGEITNFLSVITAAKLPEEKENTAQEIKNVRLMLDKNFTEANDNISRDAVTGDGAVVDGVEDNLSSVEENDEQMSGNDVDEPEVIDEFQDVEDSLQSIKNNEEDEVSTVLDEDISTEIIEPFEVVEDVNSEEISDDGDIIAETSEASAEIIDLEENSENTEDEENATSSSFSEILENEKNENESLEVADSKSDIKQPEIVEDVQEEIVQDIQDDDLDFLQYENSDEFESEISENVVQDENLDDDLLLLPQEDSEVDNISGLDEVSENKQKYAESDNEEIYETETNEIQEVANDEEQELDDGVVGENEEFFMQSDQEELLNEPFISEQENQAFENIIEEEPLQEENSEQPVYEEIQEPEFEMPVFSPADETISSDAIEPEFVEGNIVFHEKYGRGIIEKVISYGTKTLCSIQFDNIGRRLLDPNLADLKQV